MRTITVRLTDTEAEIVDAAVVIWKYLSRSELVRELVLDGLTRKKLRPEARQQIARERKKHRPRLVSLDRKEAAMRASETY